MTTSSGPFGPLAPFVASLTAMAVVVAAVAIHVLEALGRATGDPFLDNAALLVIGVVLGIGAIGGTASTALSEASAAHARLDAIAAPPATTNGGPHP